MNTQSIKNQIQSLIKACDWALTQSCGSSEILADVLLSCYNGSAYPCNLSRIRNLDNTRFEWVQDIINLHFKSQRTHEIHEFIKDGSNVFTMLAKQYKK